MNHCAGLLAQEGSVANFGRFLAHRGRPFAGHSSCTAKHFRLGFQNLGAQRNTSTGLWDVDPLTQQGFIVFQHLVPCE